MDVPTKFQVFDHPISLPSKDEERLSHLLLGWMRLAPRMVGLNEPDLQRLIVMELLGKQRSKIVKRLLGRLKVVHGSLVERRVMALIK